MAGTTLKAKFFPLWRKSLFTCLCNMIKISLFHVKFIFRRPILSIYVVQQTSVVELGKNSYNCYLQSIVTTINTDLFRSCACLRVSPSFNWLVSFQEVRVVGVHEDLMPSRQQEQASRNSRSCNSELLVKIPEVNFCLFPFFAESVLFPLHLYVTFFYCLTLAFYIPQRRWENFQWWNG